MLVSKNIFNKLPKELFKEIQKYVNINNLLNITNLPEDIKKELYFWNLSKKYSLKFYKDLKFREIIISKMYNTKKQLQINLNYYNLTDISKLGNIYLLDLSDSYKLRDVSVLGIVHTLVFSDCKNITDEENFHILNLVSCDTIVINSTVNIYKIKLF